MKKGFCVAVLAALAGAAFPHIVAHGQIAPAQTPPKTAAKPKSVAPAKPGTTTSKPAPATGASASNAALVAQGKARYEAYKCKDCHGVNGEGSEDGPDLIGTKKNAEEIAKFLNKPSADADAKGMPDIPPTSPDLKPLVAYVLSLKGSKPPK
jgi:mono/diheme cytochrome c family protein